MVAILTVLSVAPGLLIMVTSFTRFTVALSFLRSGLGMQSTPANLVLISLSLFMTFFVMSPTFDRAWQNGLKPLMDNAISQQEAYGAITQPFREFMLAQVREKDIALFEDLSKGNFEIKDRTTVDLRILIPAFMISELRRGFEIGFLIVLPFLVIDMIVSDADDVDGHDDAAAVGHLAAGEDLCFLCWSTAGICSSAVWCDRSIDEGDPAAAADATSFAQGNDRLLKSRSLEGNDL